MLMFIGCLLARYMIIVHSAVHITKTEVYHNRRF